VLDLVPVDGRQVQPLAELTSERRLPGRGRSSDDDEERTLGDP
jgi:hypothetical protein